MVIKVFQSSFNFSVHSYNSPFDCPSRELLLSEKLSDLPRTEGEQSSVPGPTVRVLPPALPSPKSTRFCFHYLIFICPIIKQGRGQILKGLITRTEMTNFQISGKTPCLGALYKPSVTHLLGECKPCCSLKIITLSIPLISTGKQNSHHQVIYLVLGSLLGPFQILSHSTLTTTPRVAVVIICIVQGRILRQSDKGTCPVAYISKWQS